MQPEAQNNPDLLANQAMRLLDTFEAELEQGNTASWTPVLERLETIFAKYGSTFIGGRRQSPIELPTESIDDTYEELQSKLFFVRQALARGIASEKHLEQQLAKNKEHVATWRDRESTAVAKENSELTLTAQHRHKEYAKAGAKLEEHLEEQRKSNLAVRARLTEFENFVQSAYTKKLILASRHAAAEASMNVIEAMKDLDSSDILSALDDYEKLVEDCELEVASSLPDLQTKSVVPNSSWTKLARILERNISIMQKLQETIQNQNPEK